MKAKKILASVLATALVASSLPLNVSAMTQTGQGDNTAKIDITVAKSFGNGVEIGGSAINSTDDLMWIDGTSFNDVSSITKAEIQAYSKLSGDEEKQAKEAEWESGIDEAVALCDGLYQGSSNVTAKVGETVYVGVDFSWENTDDTYHGMTMASAYIVFPSDVFEYDGGSNPVTLNPVQQNMILGADLTGTQKATFAKMINARFTGKNISGAGTPSVSLIENIQTYQDTRESSPVVDPSSKYKALFITLDNTGFVSGTDNIYPMSDKGTWDLVLPLKVKSGATPGDAKIGVAYDLKDNNDCQSAFSLTKTAVDNATDLTTNVDSYKYGVGERGQDSDKVTVTEATVTIDGPAIEIGTSEIRNEDEQEITVNLKGGETFTEDAKQTGKWTVTKSGDSKTLTVSGVAVNAGESTATLTVDASSAAAGEKYTVTAQDTALSSGATLTSKNTVTVVKALKGTVKINGGDGSAVSPKFDDTLTASWEPTEPATPDTVNYQWYRGESKIDGATSATYKVVEADIGQTLKCEATADDYKGSIFSTPTNAVAKAEGTPPASGKSLSDKAFGADITEEIKNLFDPAEVIITGADGTGVYYDSATQKVYVKNYTGSGTVSVASPETETHEQSTPVTVDVTGIKPATAKFTGTTGKVTSGSTFTFPALEDLVTTPGDIAKADVTLEWTGSDNTNVENETTVVDGQVTPTLTGENDSEEVTYTASLSGADAAYYTLDNTSFTLTVNNTPKTTLELDSNVTPQFTFTPNTVEKNTTETITINAPSSGTYRITGVSADKGTVEWDSATPNQFEYTAIDSAQDETANITVEYVEVVNVTLSSTAKTYDGTTAVPAENITNDKSLTLTFNAAYESAEVGSGKKITIEDIVVTNPAENTEYTFTGDDGTGVVTINDGEITQATATQIVADVYSSKDLGASVSDLATALMTQNITVKTATGEFAAYETLGDILTQVNLEAAIQAYLNATYPVAATPVEISDEIDYTQAAQTVSTVTAETGATITLAGLADDATITATSGSGDFEIAADGKSVTVKAGAGSLDGATLTVTNGDASTCTITFTTFTVNNVADTGVDAIPEDTTAKILLDETNIESTSKTYKNFVLTGLDSSDESTALVIEVKHEKQTSGGGGGIVGNLVSYEVGENGTIVEGSSSEYVNTGDKPVAVPTVDAKAGYTFMGWSLDKETYVDPATVVINGSTTFYAMYQKGYINGYEDGLFYPARNVTRAEFTKMLVMATGLYNGGKTYAATDLKDDKGAWYTNYIACAVEAGIVDGYEDGNFYPDRTITRQEAAKMVFVAMGDVTEVTTTDKITDFDTVSNWAKTYVASLVEADVIAGYEDGTFQPKRLISRAETATMIDRIAGFDPTDEEKAEIASTIAPTFEDVTPDSWAYAYIMFGCGELDDSYYA